ncbi:MAG: xanthine dehydrogenase family protein molybdopterin-binding subunit [Flavitalea sp.]
MGFFGRKTAPKAPSVRVEGVEKVTGAGKYAAEYKVNKVAYGVLVTSTIASGTIESINVEKANLVEGVIDILTHEKRPTVEAWATEDSARKSGFSLPLLHTKKIFFKGQPIALVVADSLEDATYAASLVTATYKQTDAIVDFDIEHPKMEAKSAGKERGSTDAWTSAASIHEAEYNIRHQVHNPMEMHASIAEWVSDNKLRLYDKNQGVNSVQQVVAGIFKIPKENIEVFSEFVGGGFGSGLRVWSNLPLAIMAAKQVKRPVKVMLTRPQMFILTGYRPQSWQKIKVGANASGELQGLWHQSKHNTSMFETYNEGITRISRLIYKSANVRTDAAIIPLNLGTPTWMRGPGDCTGAFALECALDELSYKLKMDPVELRLKNVSVKNDPETGKPWSTNFMDECIKRGAEQIGWKDRKPEPASLKEGDWMVGYGMGLGSWFAGRGKAGASIIMQKNGDILVQTAMTDIGTGTGTGMQNIAHLKLGLSHKKIKIKLGHSNLPAAPSQGGSTGLSSMSGAVTAVCEALKTKLASLAALSNAAYRDAKHEDLILSDKGISLKKAGNQSISFNALLLKNNLEKIEVEASSAPGDEQRKYAFCSAVAHFCKLRVHTKTGKVKVERMVSIVDAGYIVNTQAAANQVTGATVGGIGMALSEEQLVDSRYGSLVGNDLAGYHFAVNADAPIIETSFINKPDYNLNPVGSKGVGEVGIIGSAAAIANAIYHATGKRLRDLPITPDKVLMA